jgi:hypothetical protein
MFLFITTCWHSSLLSVILDIVVAEVAVHGAQSQDPLVVQGKLFIGNTIAT